MATNALFVNVSTSSYYDNGKSMRTRTRLGQLDVLDLSSPITSPYFGHHGFLKAIVRGRLIAVVPVRPSIKPGSWSAEVH